MPHAFCTLIFYFNFANCFFLTFSQVKKSYAEGVFEQLVRCSQLFINQRSFKHGDIVLFTKKKTYYLLVLFIIILYCRDSILKMLKGSVPHGLKVFDILSNFCDIHYLKEFNVWIIQSKGKLFRVKVNEYRESPFDINHQQIEYAFWMFIAPKYVGY